MEYKLSVGYIAVQIALNNPYCSFFTMEANIIRALIFFIAGAFLIFLPREVYALQVYFIKILSIKYDTSKEVRYHIPLGVGFITVGAVLFLYAVIW